MGLKRYDPLMSIHGYYDITVGSLSCLNVKELSNVPDGIQLYEAPKAMLD